MINFESKSPTLIMGMHRSGTSLLTKCLIDLGFFAGAHVDLNYESTFFQNINEWLLRIAGGSWEYPDPIKLLLTNDCYFNQAVDYIKDYLQSRHFSKYSGSTTELVTNRLTLYQRPWGWKDPRNIFTFKIWSTIFKNPKLVYIKRNGVDVAHSLVQRAERRIKNQINVVKPFPLKTKLKHFFNPISFNSRVFKTSMGTGLDDCFKLWEVYVSAADDLYDSYQGPKMSIRFEDFVLNPNVHVKNICGFIDLNKDEFAIEAICKTIDLNKAYSFVKNQKLVDFYKINNSSNLMVKHGYSNIDIS